MTSLSRMISALLFLICILFAPVTLAQESPGTHHGAPDKSKLELFHGSAEDPPAKELLGVNDDYAGRSYLAGDEWNLHLYQPHIDKLGGGYVGVGSDQGYLLIGWSQPEYAWLIDYDPLVIVTHKLYHAFFMEAATPEEFIALWTEKKREEGLEIIARYWKDDEHYGQLQRIYEDVGPKIVRRHRRIRRIMKKAKIPCYLTDQARYDYVRGMVATKRVRPMLGNLLDKQALTGIGEAAEKMDVPIRVFYLSNAQEYWSYPKQFRKNVAALPFDEQSVVLHTLSTWSTNKDYRYVLQPALNFASWIAQTWVRKVYYMIPTRKLEGAEDIDFIEFDGDVERARKRHEKRQQRKKQKKS